MSNVPNMSSELFDAVRMAFKDEQDVELDCMLYLRSLPESSNLIDDWFEQQGRCENCGEKLVEIHVREPHTEFNPVEYEDMCEIVCPYCDLGREVEY